ncbi:MAG: alpha/beta fold hydrolase [Bacteroidota bacterium]
MRDSDATFDPAQTAAEGGMVTGGHMIHYEKYGSSGPVIVLVHGYMVTGRMFDPIIDELSQEFRLIVVDNRGFGGSKDLEGPYTIEQMAADVIHVINHEGLDRVHLVGYSKGGTIAQLVAKQHPERLKSLTLTVTFAYKALSSLERMQRQFLPTLVKRVGAKGVSRLMFDGLVGGLNLPLKDFRNLKRMVASNRDDVLIHVGMDLFKFDSRDWLKEITTPTQVIGGMQDIMVPLHHQRMLAGSIPGASLKLYSDAGHGLILSHREPYAERIRAFVIKHEEEGARGAA